MLASQLAYAWPAAKEFRKQAKSWTLRTGVMVDASQLAKHPRRAAMKAAELMPWALKRQPMSWAQPVST